MRDAFSDLLLGGRCAACRSRGRVLCGRCAALLPDGGHPVRPDPAPAGLPPVLAGAEYADPLRRLILEHKERQAFGLAEPLGQVLAAVLTDLVAAAGAPSRTVVVLVPVPSSPSATRRRGHDPVLRMTRVAAGRLALHRPVACVRLLRIARPVLDQAGLDSAARAANLAGRLAVRGGAHRRLAGNRHPVLVILCDDVVTTGATLAEAQRALRAVGLPAAAAATLAATRKRAADGPLIGGSLPLS